MSALLFILACVVGPFAALSVFYWFLKGGAENDPYMQSLASENVRDQIERPLSWRG